ncbi:hypothetical protein O6H91_09G107300 [Diphasiastrum complanatum]|uniref:Uncharacterized protein n=1 Tax=Diphasiastrum complanatum TaxID=34168 RepID=A0ACC2CSU3_DIPCM|nr:hypothetical protein O6H91_09G107300 [Diphasiastrum complanatum]
MYGMKAILKGNSKNSRKCFGHGYLSGRYGHMDGSYRMCIRCVRMVVFLSLVTFMFNSGPELLWLFSTGRMPPLGDSELLSRGLTSQGYIRKVLPPSWPSVSKALLEESSPVYRRELLPKELNYSSLRTDFPTEGYSNPLNLATGVKIYVYDLPPKFNQDWLVDSRCNSHLFAAEVAIHRILLSSPVRTLIPSEADFFFLPVYVSCNFNTITGFPYLGHARELLQNAVQLISKMPYWNRSGGSDHLVVASHDYGACFHAMEDLAISSGVPDFLRKSIILQTFAQNKHHPCQDVDHIQIPPYVAPIQVLQRWPPPEQHVRNIWAFFRGKMEIHPKNISGRIYSRGIRTTIWRKFSHSKKFYIKRKKSEHYQSEILRSIFCLCPLGWAPWSPRIVESVVFGCVPVIIADDIALPYSHVINWNKISLTVPERDVHKLDRILQHVALKNLTVIQNNLWKEENRRALLYIDPMVKGDATWQILDQLARKKLAMSENLRLRL